MAIPHADVNRWSLATLTTVQFSLPVSPVTTPLPRLSCSVRPRGNPSDISDLADSGRRGGGADSNGGNITAAASLEVMMTSRGWVLITPGATPP